MTDSNVRPDPKHSLGGGHPDGGGGSTSHGEGFTGEAFTYIWVGHMGQGAILS